MRFVWTLLLASAVSVAAAQENLTAKDYRVVEEMIPMRDGVRLHTLIVEPKRPSNKLPLLMQRGPYGWSGLQPDRLSPTMLKEGFLFVFQDIRGRYASEGKFAMMRPKLEKSGAKIDESTDAYDTVDWLIKHVKNNNGRVAETGTSYLGWTALEAATRPHPALKFAVPAASPIDMFLNDDFHRNGAFRLSYGFEYCYMMETGKENTMYKFDLPDTYDWYLRLGALSHVNEKFFHGKVPTWNAFVGHPNHDKYWTDQSVASMMTTPKLPMLNVGGFWDQEDPWGPQETFRLLSRNDPNHWNHILIGPWNHGGWTGSRLDAIDFGPAAGKKYQQVILSCLKYYLKGQGKPDLPAAQVFVSGSNQWRSFDAWPPKNDSIEKLYLSSSRGLSFEKTNASGEPDTYVSKPADPVPYRKRPIEATYEPNGSGWYTWQVQDQRFVSGRDDVLTYRSPILDKPINVVGNLKAHLCAATSGTDSDWIVKLIDEYPKDGSKLSGYQLPINMEVVRARFRNGLLHPQPVAPNEPTNYTIDLHAVAHTFLPGHRLVVQIQSSWFPVIDRNPQTFLPNIFMAKDADYQPATQSIYHDRAHLSYVDLPVLGD